ncbi:MAG: hypothetical protein QM759_06940 [Terricaulis sp.]
MRLPGLLAVSVLMTATAAAQDVDAGGAYGHVALSAGFASPYKKTLPAGGTVSANGLGDGCTGIISDRAVYSVDYTAGAQPLFFAATASDDIMLAIYGPDHLWHCDDDSFGNRNPLVGIDAPSSGRYQIFIGVYSPATGSPDAQLLVSEGAPPPKDDTGTGFEMH